MTSTTLTTDLLPTTENDKIPPGDYHATLRKAVRIRDVLTVEFKLIRGTLAGQSVFAIFDLSSYSGKAFLHSWCQATGRTDPRDTKDLAGLPSLVTVRVKKLDGALIPIVTKFAKPLIAEVR